MSILTDIYGLEVLRTPELHPSILTDIYGLEVLRTPELHPSILVDIYGLEVLVSFAPLAIHAGIRTGSYGLEVLTSTITSERTVIPVFGGRFWRAPISQGVIRRR